ncbi:S-layer homology domain-containing protein [Paenibacillus athensensis]|nr:S-layer homology domain-containing protein [Paenibacillus athensensis]
MKSLRRASLALLLTVSAAQAASATAWATPMPGIQVTIGNVTVTTGQATYVPVTLQQPATPVGSYNMQVDFDPTALQVVAVKPTYGVEDDTACATSPQGCFKSYVDNTNGWVRVIWVDSSGGDHLIANTQQLFRLQIQAKSATKPGSKDLSINTSDPESLTFTDGDMHALSVALTPGKVAVMQPSSAPLITGTEEKKVKVVVNGKEQENSATSTTVKKDNKTVTTLKVDTDKVIEQLNQNKLKTLLLPFSDESDVVVGELNGQLVKTMEGQEAVLAIQTARASYTLPAAQIKIDDVSGQIGKEVALQDIKVSITISEASADKAQQVQASAKGGSMSVVASPVDFELQASYGDKKVEVSQFNSYVEREIAIPDGVDPSQITTGVVADESGNLVHVPTKITQKDGRYYAQIKSLTNSTYAVVWHPKTFADVEQHWAKREVNDLASRLILQGATDDTFAPERTITRAEFTAILLRALGLHSDKAGTQVSFSDVGTGDWFRSSVTAAASYGLINGYEDGTFQPNASITRAEAMVMINRAAGLAQLEQASADERAALLSGFSDSASVGGWAQAAVASTIKLGIVQGADGKLSPAQQITRAQTAVMVRRLLIEADLINE